MWWLAAAAVSTNNQDDKPVVAMFYTVWAGGPTTKAAQRLDRQVSSVGDSAHFLLVNCSPGLENLDIQAWARKRKLRFIDHYKLLGPAPKYVTTVNARDGES